MRPFFNIKMGAFKWEYVKERECLRIEIAKPVSPGQRGTKYLFQSKKFKNDGIVSLGSTECGKVLRTLKSGQEFNEPHFGEVSKRIIFKATTYNDTNYIQVTIIANKVPFSFSLDQDQWAQVNKALTYIHIELPHENSVTDMNERYERQVKYRAEHGDGNNQQYTERPQTPAPVETQSGYQSGFQEDPSQAPVAEANSVNAAMDDIFGNGQTSNNNAGGFNFG